MSTEAEPSGSTDLPSPSTDTPGAQEGSSLPTSPAHVKSKVDVLLKAAGDAPIIKKKKWSVERHKRIAYISDFIKKLIKLPPSESIFLYVNQSFAPAPDTEIGNIFDCFGSDGKLVLHYSLAQAWG